MPPIGGCCVENDGDKSHGRLAHGCCNRLSLLNQIAAYRDHGGTPMGLFKPWNPSTFRTPDTAVAWLEDRSRKTRSAVGFLIHFFTSMFDVGSSMFDVRLDLFT
jgi:hypothetical protein